MMPGVYDGISARVIASNGTFRAGFVSGAGISESLLGLPDLGFLGLSENVEAARRLVRAARVPLIADADTGYGNALNVIETVTRFEDAHVAGLMIEDQAWPKRCGHLPKKTVISSAEMVTKIRAAIDARRDPNLVIMARTDAAAVEGMDAAISRANAYRQAGADILFADALGSLGEIERFVVEVDGPVVVNMGFGLRERPTTPLISAAELERIGVSAVIYPRLTTGAAIMGIENALTQLALDAKEAAQRDRPLLSIEFAELKALMGYDDYAELGERY